MPTVYKALLIGNARFDDSSLRPLSAPHNDVEALRQALVDPDRGLHDPRNVTCLLDRPHREVLQEIEQFFSSARRDDQLLLYYSGHGKSSNRSLYMCASDTQLRLLVSTSISAQSIDEMIKGSASSRIVLAIDCCHSGLLTEGRGEEDIELSIPPSLEGRGRYVLASAQGAELAADGAHLSPFTRFLAEALVSDEADANNDGFVTVREIYDFLYPRVLEVSRQKPQIKEGDAVANLILARRPAPMLVVDDERLDFGTVEIGEAVPPRSFRILNAGGGQLNARVRGLEPWIRAAIDHEVVTVYVEPTRPTRHLGKLEIVSRGGTAFVEVIVAALPAGTGNREDVDRLLIELDRLFEKGGISAEARDYCQDLLAKWPLPEGDPSAERMQLLMRFARNDLSLLTLQAYLRAWVREPSPRPLPQTPAPPPPQTTSPQAQTPSQRLRPPPPKPSTPPPPPPQPPTRAQAESPPQVPLLAQAQIPSPPQTPSAELDPGLSLAVPWYAAIAQRLRTSYRRRAVGVALAVPLLLCFIAIMVNVLGATKSETGQALSAESMLTAPGLAPSAPPLQTSPTVAPTIPAATVPSTTVTIDTPRPDAATVGRPYQPAPPPPAPLVLEPFDEARDVDPVVNNAIRRCAQYSNPAESGFPASYFLSISSGGGARVRLESGLIDTPLGTCLKNYMEGHNFGLHSGSYAQDRSVVR